jgi:hypothetical protein
MPFGICLVSDCSVLKRRLLCYRLHLTLRACKVLLLFSTLMGNIANAFEVYFGKA